MTSTSDGLAAICLDPKSPRRFLDTPCESPLKKTDLKDTLPGFESCLAGETPVPLKPAPDSVPELALPSLLPKSTSTKGTSPPVSTRKSAMDAANAALAKDVTANSIWQYYVEGKYPRTALAKAITTRVASMCRPFRHYFSLNDGKDKESIHDACQKFVPQIFCGKFPAHRGWRSASLDEFLVLAQFSLATSREQSLFYGWFKGEPGLRFRVLLISLSQTPPDAFDTLYVCGALSSSIEGLLWVAANRVLGSIWRARKIPPRPAASKNDPTP